MINKTNSTSIVNLNTEKILGYKEGKHYPHEHLKGKLETF